MAFTCGLLFLASEQEVYSLILPVVSIVSLNPNFITGFSDADGCFYIQISKDNRCQTGYQVIASFTIGLDKRDIALLKEIQLFFGVGNINTHGNMVYSKVTSIKDLSVIIAHFDKYLLLTQKQADFLLFKPIVEMINRGEHLTPEGLRKIVAIRTSINNGLSDT